MNRKEMWYQSAEIAEAKDGILYFEVSKEQKEYMESHMDEVDKKLARKSGIDLPPHTIRFEKDWNGEEECYTCEAYWS
jgi:hypothetical protein